MRRHDAIEVLVEVLELKLSESWDEK